MGQSIYSCVQYHPIDQSIYQLCIMQLTNLSTSCASCDRPTYLPAAYHAIDLSAVHTVIDQPIYQLRTMQSANLSTSCVPCNQSTYLQSVYHVINQPIYELYVMQLISTVEADSKDILLLVNLC